LRNAQRWLTWVSTKMASVQAGQTVLQECWDSVQRWLTSISTAMTSVMLGEGGLELREMVKPLVFFCRHLALLAL
jgi:hypothetical protein